MNRRALRLAPLLFLFAPVARADEPLRFDRDVLPILSDNCFACHGPDAGARKAELRLDTAEGALRKAEPVIVAGKSAESEIIRRILSADPDEVMPPPKFNKRPNPKQIEILKRWIDSGAGWGKHWAFEKPVRPAVPQGVEGARNAVDAFLFARLKREGLKPSPQADRDTLLRRLTLDLTGLPPTPAEADAFRNDNSPNAYEAAVDRLLKSPRYGERMVWEWLEASRYADSNGYQGDGERTMWPWRDWAVGAFNDNVRFDRFTIEQIAGDRLPDATDDTRLPTGFLRNHAINGEGGRIPEENRVDYVMDMAETVGTVWLGLTFNCCRCHDHKFDAIKQSDYYGLFAFFNQTPVTGAGGDPQTKPVVERIDPKEKVKLADAEAKTAESARRLEAFERSRLPCNLKLFGLGKRLSAGLPKDVRDALAKTPTQRNTAQSTAIRNHFKGPSPYATVLKDFTDTSAARDAIRKSVVRVMVMEDIPKPRDTFIYSKGLYNKPGEKVGAGVPGVLPPLPAGAVRDRLALAKWLVAPENPLTARVTVNRFWQQFFGVGLVKTANDFGVQGERPVHPELLDWLAVEFVESGWDVKALVRLMVTSAAYRQSSRVSPDLVSRDPENRLLARGARFRMPSWMIRDQALAASGLLVGRIGGPPVRPYQPGGIWEEATFGNKRYTPDKGEGLYRRSLYTFWRRIVGPTMFFDTTPRQFCSVKQVRTNTPLHALATLNDTTYVEASRMLAQVILKDAGSDADRLNRAFGAVLVRGPSADESTILLAGLKRLREQYRADPKAAVEFLSVGDSPRDAKLDAVEHAAWTALCSLIFNLDEALTRE